MKQKVLITGGFGFVGSQLLQLLLRRNDLSITVVDNFLSGGRLSTKGIRFIGGDIRNPKVLAKIVPEQDTIVHLAAVVGEPACLINKQFAYDVNVIGTRNVLAAMTKNQRLIYTSSTSVYGERPNVIVTEDMQPLPLNNYAQHKYTSEKDIIASGRDYVILRPVTAFGVTERLRMDLLVNELIYDALSYLKMNIFTPSIMRPIIHVIDFARILIEGIDGRLEVNETYNIGDPHYRVTKMELAQLIANLTGAKVQTARGSNLDPRDYDVSFDKLLATGFIFPPDRLQLAVEQIRKAQREIAMDQNAFTAPYKVKLFLDRERESKGV